jgi:hypothetical protein
VLNDSVGEVLCTLPSLTLLQYLAKIRKGICKSFAAVLVDLPPLRTALTSGSSACVAPIWPLIASAHYIAA